MSATPSKFIALNATAARRQQYVTGNPVSTRLESSVGNCFPGLEMDLRNLERRFFPFLEVDFVQGMALAQVVGVDLAGVKASSMPDGDKNAYAAIAADMGSADVQWLVTQMAGDFGIFGSKSVSFPTQNPSTVNGDPPDAWTAVRVLPQGKPVTITVARVVNDQTRQQVTLTQNRVAYLDENGALNSIFEPGELSQSLCSPWTHDFRDCACFYWASNHPDVVLPPAPENVPEDRRWRVAVPWERSQRGTPDNPSAAATPNSPRRRELDYYEINGRWQELDIAVEGRELRRPYVSGLFRAVPLADLNQLEAALRYAAGVERAAIETYLTAAYSITPSPANTGSLVIDVATAFAEVMRVAISEMRHLRIANDVLRSLNEQLHPGAPFRPGLQIADVFPASGGTSEPVVEKRMTPDVLDEFIAIEKPSDSIDGVYGRIVVTLENNGLTELGREVRSVMADGFDHYETFLDIREWLAPHQPTDYLLNLRQPDPNDPAHQHLQEIFLQLMQTLRRGYAQGLPGGADDIARARDLMLGNGIMAACERLRANGTLVVFDPITDDPDFGVVKDPV
jgi:Ferritin-like